jgi:hypothetical protein
MMTALLELRADASIGLGCAASTAVRRVRLGVRPPKTPVLLVVPRDGHVFLLRLVCSAQPARVAGRLCLLRLLQRQ